MRKRKTLKVNNLSRRKKFKKHVQKMAQKSRHIYFLHQEHV